MHSVRLSVYTRTHPISYLQPYHARRMRVDDDMVWGGGNNHGLYAMDNNKYTVAADFLVFCKLAVLNKVRQFVRACVEIFSAFVG